MNKGIDVIKNEILYIGLNKLVLIQDKEVKTWQEITEEVIMMNI